ncbi:MAG: helix-turn-helix domain-containing protein, partial [Pseudomonadota bacterium]|nr:helix-turn-helix domain-containing protein [Pseudomonadota bacterium]
WRLVNIIYQMEGEPLFGLKAAMELALQDFKSVKPHLKNCSTLKNLLERFISIVPSQTNAAHYVLIDAGDLVWFSQQGPRLIDDYQQIELFEIAGMIQLVQSIAGKHWRPSEIHFSFNYDKDVFNSEHLNPSKILFSKPCPAIAIPRKLLQLNVPLQIDIANEEKDSLLPGTYSNQLLTALQSYIGERKLNDKLLTDICGVSFRTIQRKLAQENTSYTDIIDRGRFIKSQHLLENTDEKLLDISLMLGYKNASTFTRAFKRWTGVTPLEFRK